MNTPAKPPTTQSAATQLDFATRELDAAINGAHVGTTHGERLRFSDAVHAFVDAKIRVFAERDFADYAALLNSFKQDVLNALGQKYDALRESAAFLKMIADGEVPGWTVVDGRVIPPEGPAKVPTTPNVIAAVERMTEEDCVKRLAMDQGGQWRRGENGWELVDGLGGLLRFDTAKDAYAFHVNGPKDLHTLARKSIADITAQAAPKPHPAIPGVDHACFVIRRRKDGMYLRRRGYGFARADAIHQADMFESFHEAHCELLDLLHNGDALRGTSSVADEFEVVELAPTGRVLLP